MRRREKGVQKAEERKETEGKKTPIGWGKKKHIHQEKKRGSDALFRERKRLKEKKRGRKPGPWEGKDGNGSTFE